MVMVGAGLKRNAGGLFGDLQHLGKIDVQSGVFDSKCEGVVNHLDLQSFFARRIWEWFVEWSGTR